MSFGVKKIATIFVPRSLRWQFRLALTILALLIATASWISFLSLRQSVAHTRQLAGGRLVQMEAMQELGKTAMLIELETNRMLSAVTEERIQTSYTQIIPLLDKLDRQAGQLGSKEDDIAVLAMYQAEQIFRNIIHVVVGLRTLELQGTSPAGGRNNRQRFSDELARQASAMAAATGKLSTRGKDDYQAAVHNLAVASEKSSRLVLTIFIVSMIAAWLFFYFVLEKRVLARLHEISRHLLWEAAQTGHALVAVRGGDEIGRMARSVEQFMADRLQLAVTNRVLQQTNDMLQSILNAAPTAIIDLDLDGNVHSIWNKAAEKMLGWSAAEVIGRPLPTVPMDKEGEFQRFREQIRKGLTLNGVEVQRCRRDGSPIDFSIFASPLYDDMGNVTGNIAVMVDISERRRMEDALREIKNRLSTMINTIPDLIWLKDPEGVYLTCNPEFELFYGAAEKDILGKTDYDFVSGELAAFFRKKDQEAIAAGRISINEEEVVYRSDGRHVTLETRKVPVFDANGSVLGVLGIGRNITERKRMEAQLLSSENRLRDILNSTSDWIWEVDAKGCYTFCSEGIQRVLKYRPEEMLGRTPFDLMPSEEQGRGRTAFLELVEQKAPLVDLENWNVAKNGRRVCLVTNGVPLLDDQGDLLGYRGADRDITVQKMLQIQVQERTEELERSNRELEQFAYAASHDLQEPLRMVASYVKLLARRYKGKLDADADDFINYAADGAERMQRMINDLLAYSRITTKGQEPELVDSTNCLKTALANLSLSIEEAGADVTNSDLPQVLADENQINQLFQNLVGNALKFSKPGEIPRIHVDAIQQDKELLFSVRDNGIGIKKEDQDRIFQLFHRLHTREEYPGTGIGLSLCQRIVVRHGGRIWVESESGSGATFYFTLPLPKESNHV
ncbi:PAS domain S-box protein [uncultured Desulfobacter sp.]|uniref:PAS domain S-box protein n=1 Tax=uncultured Desulfobacter sp. TaxID=240139 RepID=UPI002AAB9EF0|nr:PAS domain S-box protein [uncultured Desulfobacter sp.]